MEKRGTKPEFTNVFCPDQDCKFMAFLEKGITQATAHMRSKKPKIMEHESGGSLNLDPDL
jgi:hypothetical protein